LAPTYDNQLALITYYPPDDRVDINSFLARNREQYFATLPLRFGLESSQVAVYLANLVQAVVDKITGAMWIETDVAVKVANASIPASQLQPSTQFITDVNNLPATYDANPQAYKDFVYAYGTHMVQWVVLGARASTIVKRSSCDVKPSVALNAEVKRITDQYIGNNTDLSTLDRVAGGPSSTLLYANGLKYWADNTNLNNAVRIEVGLLNISVLVRKVQPSGVKAAGIDQAVNDLMPTSEAIQLPPELECLLNKLTAGQIVGIVIGVIAGVGIIGYVIYFVFFKVVSGAVNVVSTVADTAMQSTTTGQKGQQEQGGV
jgi:hypothetical protein